MKKTEKMTVNTLSDRIEGLPGLRILLVFATNSGLYPLFDAIRSISTNGFNAYVTSIAHYAMFLAAFVQAWYLGRKPVQSYRWWQRALGNLIAVGVYSVLDILLEGPADFFSAPYHYVFWAYSIGMAIFEPLTTYDHSAAFAKVLTSLLRVSLFPSLYALSELQLELAQTDLFTFQNYWTESPGHIFILVGSILFGLMLGLSEAQLSQHMGFLRRTAHLLKTTSEWSIAPGLLAESLENPEALAQRRVQRAVLFMDLRGFTRWSEDKAPEQVVTMLNRFYEIAEAVILSNQGSKPHFIGDEVMTWFANPNDAIQAAHHLTQVINTEMNKVGLSAGLGLHAGPIVEGLMGTGTTRSYNIIGDTVNTAARLCSAAQPNEAILSQDMIAWAGSDVPIGDPRHIEAKGKSEPIRVYPLLNT